MPDELIPYRKGMEYGIGIDSPHGDARNVAVLGEPTGIPDASGSVVTFQLMQVSTDEDLQSALGVSASASAGVGCFSASASMDFAQKCHVHDQSVFLLVVVDVNLGFSQIRAPKIDPAAAALLADGSTGRFQQMYGDCFVRGIQTGGRFYSVCEIFTHDRSDQQSLSTALEGSYGPFSAEGSFSSSFTSAISSRSLKITTRHEGGVVPKEPTSLEAIQSVAETFAASVKGNAVPYAVLLDSYSILDLPAPPNYVDLQNQLDVLAFCARQRNAIWTNLNRLDYVFANPAQFEIGGAPDALAPLADYRTALEVDLGAVTKAASQALDHPRDAMLPVLTAQPPAMPERRAGEADALADAGAAVAAADELAAAIRDALPAGPQRQGYLVGLGTEAANTAWGPGAESIRAGLDAASQAGFDVGARYCLMRNNQRDLAARGAEVVAADPAVRAARGTRPAGLYWLGFDIGAGLFGDPAAGGSGHTLPGPGSDAVRDGLVGEARAGFEDARVFCSLRRR